MSNKTLSYFIGSVIIGVGLLLLINFSTAFWPSASVAYISRNDVRGVATAWKGKLWTLNFDQQNKIISYLNSAEMVGPLTEVEGHSPFLFNKVVIYRFDKPDLTVTPIAFDGAKLLFSVPEWNPDGLLRENNPGEIQELLSQTYDK